MSLILMDEALVVKGSTEVTVHMPPAYRRFLASIGLAENVSAKRVNYLIASGNYERFVEHLLKQEAPLLNALKSFNINFANQFSSSVQLSTSHYSPSEISSMLNPFYVSAPLEGLSLYGIFKNGVMAESSKKDLIEQRVSQMENEESLIEERMSDGEYLTSNTLKENFDLNPLQAFKQANKWMLHLYFNIKRIKQDLEKDENSNTINEIINKSIKPILAEGAPFSFVIANMYTMKGTSSSTCSDKKFKEILSLTGEAASNERGSFDFCNLERLKVDPFFINEFNRIKMENIISDSFQENIKRKSI